MNIDPIRPVIKVLTNRYSWLAVGMAFGHFGLGALSPEWKALVDLGTTAAVALLALFPEKGQLGHRQEEQDVDQSDRPDADPDKRLHDVGLPSSRKASRDEDPTPPPWIGNQ